MMLTLDQLTAVLGCSKAAASMVRAGKYPAKDGRLSGQYEALVKLVDEVRIGTYAQRCESICMECPRDDCHGCRVAELSI